MQLDVILLALLTSVGCTWAWRPKEYRQNSEPGQKPCIFPTVHRRTAMYECQNSLVSVPTGPFQLAPNQQNRGIWWCSLTDNFDHYPEWRICPETPTTYGGNQPGRDCHFPFIHQKRIYHTCIREGGELRFQRPDDPVPVDDGRSGYWWCATTPNFDKDRFWTRCRSQHAHQLPCHFTKHTVKVGGLVQDVDHECQPFAGHWVCHTELNQLRECPSALVGGPSSSFTEGGNDPGFQCHFPFQATLPLLTADFHWVGTARRRNITTCLPGLTTSSGLESIYPPWIGYWCATTSNFDEDKLWTRCTHPQESGQSNSLKHLANHRLSEIWTHLTWLRWISPDEHRNFNLPGQAYSVEFKRVLSEVEKLRSKWDFTSNAQCDEELQWWAWLAPFWWTKYQSNQTTWPVAHTSTETINSEVDSGINPLSRGFQLPRWVQAWNSAGWLRFGKGLNERWTELKYLVQKRWDKAWTIAFLSGVLCATGFIAALLLMLLAFIDRFKRRQLVRIFCRRSMIKEPTLGSVHGFEGDAYNLYAPLSKYPPGYLHNASSTSDCIQTNVSPPVDTAEMCNPSKLFPSNHPLTNCDYFTDAFHSQKDSVIDHNQPELILPKLNSTVISISNESTVRKKQSHIAGMYQYPYVCCSSSNVICPCRKQQNRLIVNLLIALTRKPGDDDQSDKSNILQQFLPLLSNCQLANRNCVCPVSDSSENGRPTTQFCTFGHAQCFERPRVEPSAPPPSYDQLDP